MILKSDRRMTFQFLVALLWFLDPLRASDNQSGSTDSRFGVFKVNFKHILQFL